MEIDKIKQVYAALDEYVVTLHPDPVTLGPKYLQDTIAKIRNYLNAVSKILLDVGAEKHHLSREIRKHEDVFKIMIDETMASDERVKKQPNIRDREALANTLHVEEFKTIAAMKADFDGLVLVEKAIRHRHNELRDTMADLKTQKSLIQSEIDTGSMYGDERVRGPSLTMPDEMTEEEADSILGGASSPVRPVKTVSFEPPPPKEVPRVVVFVHEESKVQELLPIQEAVTEPPPQEVLQMGSIVESITIEESVSISPVVAASKTEAPPVQEDEDIEDFMASMSKSVAAQTSSAPPPSKAPDSDVAIDRFLNGGPRKALAAVEDEFLMSLLDD